MKDVLLDRRTHVLAGATVVVLLWPTFVVPGGAPWSGIIWTAALAGLFVVAATGFVGKARSHPLTLNVPRVETTPRAIAEGPRVRHCGAGNPQAATTVCAEQRKEA
jgi:hypothetical protein